MAEKHSDSHVFDGTVAFNNTVLFNAGMTLPANSVTNTSVPAGANLSADKLQHRHAITHEQKDGTDVVSETILKYVARFAGTLKRFTVRPRVAPTGGDKQFTVDIQRASNGSNTWVSLLTTPVVMSSADVSDTLNDGTLVASPVYSIDDGIRIVITATGSTGSQGQGFVAVAQLDESGA
jgi:hypothetical protein